MELGAAELDLQLHPLANAGYVASTYACLAEGMELDRLRLPGASGSIPLSELPAFAARPIAVHVRAVKPPLVNAFRWKGGPHLPSLLARVALSSAR